MSDCVIIDVDCFIMELERFIKGFCCFINGCEFLFHESGKEIIWLFWGITQSSQFINNEAIGKMKYFWHGF